MTSQNSRSLNLNEYSKAVSEIYLPSVCGKVNKVIGLIIESSGSNAGMGELCDIFKGTEHVGIAEVVGFRESATLLMPLSSISEMRPGMDVISRGRKFHINGGQQLIGRVIDGLGEPLDGKGPVLGQYKISLNNQPANPLKRQRIKEIMTTGIRSIDGLRTLGKGQRMGIFSGSGVGKSVLMGMIARNCRADINVVALIGERSREVKEFLEKDLGEEGLKRSVVVVATSEKPAIVRLKAAFIATGIAEFFRARGKDVMLMMDSSTRIALAQREIGLAAGEPPTTRGFPPSVFSLLPQLFERAGMGEKGSITALYTVLVEGDDLDEPVSDAVRSVLDGHIVLSRDLANRNHYPAIDVLKSVSRCMTDVIDDNHKKNIGRLIKSMALYSESEDMISLGAYMKGSNKNLDKAIALHPDVNNFLVQGIEEKSTLEESISLLGQLAERA